MDFVSERTMKNVAFDQDEEVRSIIDSIRSETGQTGVFELEQVQMIELSNKFYPTVYDTPYTRYTSYIYTSYNARRRWRNL